MAVRRGRRRGARPVAFAALLLLALGAWTIVGGGSAAGAAEWWNDDRTGAWGWSGDRDGRDRQWPGGSPDRPASPVAGTPAGTSAGTPAATASPGAATAPASTGGGPSGQATQAAASAPASAGSASASAGGTDESDVVARINQERAAVGCDPLTVDSRLTAVAQEHSKNMADLGYIGHERPDGSSLGDRVTAAGYRWRWVGEVITNSPDPVGSWMDSPGHRAVVMDCVGANIGVGREPRGNLWTAALATPM